MAGEKNIFRNLLKYSGIFILCGWMFFLGILVGRGTAPVSFDTTDFQKKLAAIMNIKKKEKQLETKPDLGFYEMLKKPLSTGNTKFHGSEKILTVGPGKKNIKNDIKVAGQSIEIKKSRKSMTIGLYRGKNHLKLNLKPPDTEATYSHFKKDTRSYPVVSDNAMVYTIQIAAYRNLDDALKLMRSLKQKGYTVYRTMGKTGDTIWHRVRIGSFVDKKKAMQLEKKLESDKIKGIIIHKTNSE